LIAELPSMASVRFSEIANLVVDRVSRLLVTPVFVTDNLLMPKPRYLWGIAFTGIIAFIVWASWALLPSWV
jgi:hypothetical protein